MTAAISHTGAVAPAAAVTPKVAVAPAPAVTAKPTANLKGAATPKGDRRRSALVSPAAELLCEGGFEAVRHRAVARRADLPLASTTYYFSSLDDLLVQAVEYIGAQETNRLRARVMRLSRRRRGVEATAAVFVDLLRGDGPTDEVSEQMISRYERDITGARHPLLRDVQ